MYDVEKFYQRSYRRGRWGRIMQSLTGRSRRLLLLTDVIGDRTVVAEQVAYPQPIPMHQIRGTSRRHVPFDQYFHPVQEMCAKHWQRMAMAILTGVELPPVELFQVGEEYFVQDGHYRISVARALGQAYIDTYVTILKDMVPCTKTTNLATQRALGSILIGE